MSRDVNKTEVNLIFFLIYKKRTEPDVFGIKINEKCNSLIKEL